MSSEPSLRIEHSKLQEENDGFTSVTLALYKQRWMVFRSAVTPYTFRLIFFPDLFTRSLFFSLLCLLYEVPVCSGWLKSWQELNPAML